MLVEFLKDCGVAIDGKGQARQDFKAGDVADLMKGVAQDIINSGLAKAIKKLKAAPDEPADVPEPSGPDNSAVMTDLGDDERLTEEQWRFMSVNAMRDLVEDKRVTHSGKPDVKVIEEMVRQRLMTMYGAEVPYEITAKQRDDLFKEAVSTE